MKNSVTVVIPTARADERMLEECVSSLILGTNASLKIDLRVSRSPGIAINRAVTENARDSIVLANDDTMVCSYMIDWLTEMQSAMMRHHADIAAPLILDPNYNVFYAAGELLDKDGKVNLTYHSGEHSSEVTRIEQECTFCPMTFCYITRSAWQKVGLLDVFKHDCHFSDVDWMLRALKAGLRMVYVPQVIVRHVGSATFSHRPDFETQRHEDHVAFNQKWGITSA